MDFIQQHKNQLIASAKTAALSPVILLLSILSGVGRSSATFLLPSLFISLVFSLTAAVSPILFILATALSIGLGVGAMIYNIMQLHRNREALSNTLNLNQPLIQNFLDISLFSATFIGLAILALSLPFATFNIVGMIIRGAVLASFIGYYQYQYSSFCYNHILRQARLDTFQHNVNETLKPAITSQYVLDKEEYINSYSQALDLLPSHLLNKIEKENTERDYIGAIDHEILYSPVKIRQSAANFVYEKLPLINYFSQYGNRDPGTGKELEHVDLESQTDLKEAICAHKQKLLLWTQNHSEEEMSTYSPDAFSQAVYE